MWLVAEECAMVSSKNKRYCWHWHGWKIFWHLFKTYPGVSCLQLLKSRLELQHLKCSLSRTTTQPSPALHILYVQWKYLWYISHIQNLNTPVVCWDGKCHDFVLLTHLWLSHPYATSWWGMLRSVWCWITSPVSDARTWLRWRRHWAVQSASGAAGPRLKCEVICFCPERVMLQGTHGLFYCWEVILRPPSASRPFLRTCFEDVRYIETSATWIM